MERVVRLVDGVVTLAPTDAPAELVIDGKTQINTFGPEYSMLPIGAGQLTEYVATMAHFCGFSTTVCDPREGYQWSLAGTGREHLYRDARRHDAHFSPRRALVSWRSRTIPNWMTWRCWRLWIRRPSMSAPSVLTAMHKPGASA